MVPVPFSTHLGLFFTIPISIVSELDGTFVVVRWVVGYKACG